MQHSRAILAFTPLIPLLPIRSVLLLLPYHRLLLLAVVLRLLLPTPLTLSGFFTGMLEISQPGALNSYIFFCPVLLTLSVSRNLISTHLPLCGFLDSLLCDLIASTTGLAFSLVMSRTLAAASSFLLGKAYFFLKFLPLLSLLDPNSDFLGVNISLNNSYSVSFLNVYAPPIRSSPMDGRTDFFSPFILPPLEISLSWVISIVITHLGLKRYFRPSWGGSIRLGHLF